ncbi:Myosin-tail-1 multi-domain protein [Pyrenophora tritici-repentis]|nr:Myosin-tail-1 multi-domain protein [Pyrenophora tritici-repentis]
MARLSGLPSEHHHEGPGDAPRRKRGRPSKHTRLPKREMSSAGKRTASPTAEISQTKRMKRIEADDDDEDQDQIAEEIQQSFSRSQRAGETINVQTQTKRRPAKTTRRHSEPPVAVSDDEDELMAFHLLSPYPV